MPITLARPSGPAVRSWFGLSAFVALAAMGPGCTRNFSTEADRLRRQVMELQADNQALGRQVEELKATIASLGRPPEGLSEEAVAATPQLAAISIDRRSHLADRDGDGRPDLLRVYVGTADGRGRFVQVVGQLSVAATILRMDAPPLTLAQVSLSPLQVRDAYRSGFLGTHYSLELEIEWPVDLSRPAVTVSARFTDLRTGRQHDDQRPLVWERGAVPWAAGGP